MSQHLAWWICANNTNDPILLLSHVILLFYYCIKYAVCGEQFTVNQKVCSDLSNLFGN